MRFQSPVRLLKDGNFSFDYDPEVLDAVLGWAESLTDSLSEESPAHKRLFPTAYADDPEKDAGYQILARDQLIERRHEALKVMKASVSKETLTFEEISAWMGICNDLRLVLGTQLEVSEDDPEILPDDDPRAPAMHLYRVFGWMVSDIVDALSGTV